MYLRHQWSDGAVTLQLCSTDEYFETVEYEPDRLLSFEISHEIHNIFRSDPTE